MNESIRKGTDADIDSVTELYRSLVGLPGCVWNQYYPTREDVIGDTGRGDLFVIWDGNGKILGAAACGTDDEQEKLDVWSRDICRPCGISRVGICRERQHTGLARKLITYIEGELYSRGFDGVYLLAYSGNPSAVALYKSLGYTVAGQADMYDIGMYICFEKKLSGSKPADITGNRG